MITSRIGIEKSHDPRRGDSRPASNQSILFSCQDMCMASSHWFCPSTSIIRAHPWTESPPVDPQILRKRLFNILLFPKCENFRGGVGFPHDGRDPLNDFGILGRDIVALANIP